MRPGDLVLCMYTFDFIKGAHPIAGKVYTVSDLSDSCGCGTRIQLKEFPDGSNPTHDTMLCVKCFSNINNMVDVDSDAKAFTMVKKGEAHAMMTVSGWPSGPVGGLKQTDNLTLIPFDLTIGQPYQVRPVNYKNIGVYNVNSLAIPNLMLTRPFKGEKAMEVMKLKACLKQNLLNLQEGSYQPAWKEAKDMENTYGWAKFTPGSGQSQAIKVRK